MPFPSLGSATSARPRRIRERDKDIRYRSNSTSSRRSREQSRFIDGRPLLPQTQADRQIPVVQETVTLDQLPPLPLSRATSPCSAVSPVRRSSQDFSKSSTLTQLPYHFHTPAFLQPYLEEEIDPANPHEKRSLPDQLVENLTDKPLRGSQRLTRYEGQRRRETNAQAAIGPSSLRPDNVPLQPKAIVPTQTPKFLRPCTPDPPNNGVQITNQHVFAPSYPLYGTYPGDQFFGPPYPAMQNFSTMPHSNLQGGLQQDPMPCMPYHPGYGFISPLPISSNLVTSHVHDRHIQRSQEHILSPSEYPERHRPGRLPASGSSADRAYEDETLDLLYRIENFVIPDIHYMVHRQRETLRELAVQKTMNIQMEAQKVEAIHQQDALIDRLNEEMDLKSQKHAEEILEMRLGFNNLQERCKELQNKLDAGVAAQVVSGVTLENWKSRLREEHALKESTLKEDLLNKTTAETILIAPDADRKHMEEMSDRQGICASEKGDIAGGQLSDRPSQEATLKTMQGKPEGVTMKAEADRNRETGDRESGR
ncbi:hypothetical protein MMC19_004417 [Ptychographa xylographoides]|nr:hypothetical protein [Ptychographa xylographoides]